MHRQRRARSHATRRLWWGLPLVVLGTALVGTTYAKEAWTLPRAAEVAASGDAAARETLDSDHAPDPWLIAELLCLQGERGAAQTFADSRNDSPLAKYVRKRVGAKDEALAAALSTVWRARQSDTLPDAADAIQRLLTGGPLLRAYGTMSQGRVLRAKHAPDAASTLDNARTLCDALGWYEGAFAAGYLAGRTFAETGRYAKAYAAFEAIGALAKAAGNRQDELNVLQALANVATASRDMPKLLAYGRSTLTLATERKDKITMALAHSHLSDALATLGERARGRKHLEAALQIAGSLDHPRLMATLLSDLAHYQKQSQQFADAIQTYERILTIVAGNKQAEAVVALSLGEVYRLTRNPARALRYLTQARNAFVEMGNRGFVANASSKIGDMHSLLGDRAKARALYEEAEKTFAAIGNHSEAVESRVKIAKIDFQEGLYEGALAAFRALVPEAKKTARPGIEADVGFRIARTLYKMGRYDEALEHYDKAQAIADDQDLRDLLLFCMSDRALIWMEREQYQQVIDTMPGVLDGVDQMFRSLSDEENAKARSFYATMFEVGTLAAVMAEDADAMMEFLERGRAGALRATLGSTAAFRKQHLPAPLAAAQAVAQEGVRRARAQLAEARTLPTRKARRTARAQLRDAQAAHQAVVDRIQREARKAAQVIYPRVATLAETQAALAKHDVLVSLETGGSQAFALVVRPGDARVVRLPKAAAQAAQGARFEEPSDADASARLRSLQRLLIEPLALAPDATRVLVSPGGTFAQVPFGALMPDRAVSLVPSATVLTSLREARARGATRVLALGDPSYAEGTPRLPATREEVSRVGTQVLLGEDATKSRLVAALNTSGSWRAVHLACHGVVDTEHPARSSLALSPEPGDDGQLSALDVTALRLHADLVVLSACETARGRLLRAEGLLGFPRAFMFAGAPRVLCSLWKVDDDATRALMVKFYELWNPKTGSGIGAADALRRAQAHVRTNPAWEHPYYWAAWVLWGPPG